MKKAPALLGYITKRKISCSYFGNFTEKTFSVFSRDRVANKKSLNRALDKCLLHYYLIIQQHMECKKRKPSIQFLQLQFI